MRVYVFFRLRTVVAALSICAHVCAICVCVVYIHTHIRMCVILTTHVVHSPLCVCTCMCYI